MPAGEREDIPVALPKHAGPPGSRTSELLDQSSTAQPPPRAPLIERDGGSGAERPGSTLARAELEYPCGHWLCVSAAGSLILSHVCQHPRNSGCLLPCSGHHSAVLPMAPGPPSPTRSFAEVSLGNQVFSASQVGLGFLKWDPLGLAAQPWLSPMSSLLSLMYNKAKEVSPSGKKKKKGTKDHSSLGLLGQKLTHTQA